MLYLMEQTRALLMPCEKTEISLFALSRDHFFIPGSGLIMELAIDPATSGSSPLMMIMPDFVNTIVSISPIMFRLVALLSFFASGTASLHTAMRSLLHQSSLNGLEFHMILSVGF